MTQKLFSVKEVAIACGVSRDSVWRAIRRGQIETIRLGVLVKIRGEELERICAGGIARHVNAQKVDTCKN